MGAGVKGVEFDRALEQHDGAIQRFVRVGAQVEEPFRKRLIGAHDSGFRGNDTARMRHGAQPLGKITN
jgi:hypothetical protein